MEPKSTVEVKGNEAKSLLGLIEPLEEHDDVNEVHANFDIPERSSSSSQPPSRPGREPRWRRLMKASEASPRISSHASRDGDRPRRSQPRLRHRPGRGQSDGRARRRRGRDARRICRSSAGSSASTLAGEADRLARAERRWRSRTSTSARTCARRWPSARRAGSRCSPPHSAASPASPTRRRRSRWPSAAPARPARNRSSGWSAPCSACPSLPTSDHAADALAVAICHGGGAGRRAAVEAATARGSADDRRGPRRGAGPPSRPRRDRRRRRRLPARLSPPRP